MTINIKDNNTEESTFIVRPVGKNIFVCIQFLSRLGIFLALGFFPLFMLLFFLQEPKVAYLLIFFGFGMGAGMVLVAFSGLMAFVSSFSQTLYIQFRENGIDFVSKRQNSLFLHIPIQAGLGVDLWDSLGKSATRFLIFIQPNGEKIPFIYKLYDLAYLKNPPTNFIQRMEAFQLYLKQVGLDTHRMDIYFHNRSKNIKKLLIAMGLLLILFMILKFLPLF